MTQAAPTRREGGCLCGAVRYSIAWPPLMLVTCACRNCQKQSGGALSVVGVCARDALQLTGELKTYIDTADSGNAVERRFCPQCGSPVLTDNDLARERDMIFFKAGTLDETGDLAPDTHCWTASGQPWLRYPDGDTVMEREEKLG